MNYAEWLHGALDASEFLSEQLNNSVPSYITHIFFILFKCLLVKGSQWFSYKWERFQFVDLAEIEGHVQIGESVDSGDEWMIEISALWEAKY